MRALFLRGLTREIRHWNGFPEKFSRTTGIPVITLDLPGAGKNSHLTSPRDINSYVEFLRKEIPAGEKILLIGISMGGMIALRWAELYPAEVVGVYAINSSCQNVSKRRERFNFSEWKSLLNILLAKNILKKEQLVLKLTTNKLSFAQMKNISEYFEQVQKQNPVSKLSSLNQLIAASNFQIYSCPKVPVTIIYSMGDRLVSPNCGVKLAELLKNVEVKIHPDAGHDLPLDDPEWLLAFLQEATRKLF